jgi:hypothetical protein
MLKLAEQPSPCLLVPAWVIKNDPSPARGLEVVRVQVLVAVPPVPSTGAVQPQRPRSLKSRSHFSQNALCLLESFCSC